MFIMKQMVKIIPERGNSMIGRQLDRRVVKTRQIIYEAFFELMKKNSMIKLPYRKSLTVPM